jgi:uncharacterized protein YndB with AHSA1/START domain
MEPRRVGSFPIQCFEREKEMPDICHALTINASVDVVFDAINSAEGNRAFWTDQTEYEPKEGTVAVFSFGPNAETQFRFAVERLDRPREIEWKCVGGPPEWVPTSIVWTLTPAEGGTHVRFVHKGWESADGELPSCTFTWGLILQQLDQYATTGSATPPFSVY